jgi:aerobic carbon-monoxide dehydrogenase medium subunit
VRNSATICGNVAHGDPGNDHPATMLALNAAFVLKGAQGTRTVAAREFFLGLFTTALASDEIVTEIAIRVPAQRTSGAYLKLERKVGDFATAGVAAQVTVDAHGSCTNAGIGLTNVGATPILAVEAQGFLQGKPLDEPTIAQAAGIVAEASEPVADRRGSPEYKRDVVRVLAQRALRLATRRALGLEAAATDGRN